MTPRLIKRPGWLSSFRRRHLYFFLLITLTALGCNLSAVTYETLGSASPLQSHPETPSLLSLPSTPKDWPEPTSSPLPFIESPTITPAPTASPTARVPPPLPPPYPAWLLKPLDTPHTYIQDSCRYLYDRWSSTNSPPGTVVMVIMIHSITDGAITNPSQISRAEFHRLLKALHEKGFQAISMGQLADFMEHNAKIPRRSVLLIVDDRHSRQFFDIFFRPYYEAWGWPVVNAWISAMGAADPVLAGNVELSNEGWVDYQAHGNSFPHVAITQDSSDEFIQKDLQGSMESIQKYFRKTPIAYIWPGGGFTASAVQIARQAGYRLGFTINPRGPLMYNWVPLADKPDPKRPSWLPEGSVNDPLMVLPRYWDTDAIKHLDAVIQMGNEAAVYAEVARPYELEYYDILCAPVYGDIP